MNSNERSARMRRVYGIRRLEFESLRARSTEWLRVEGKRLAARGFSRFQVVDSRPDKRDARKAK